MVRRRTDYLLRKAREREHILLGFQKALDNLDAVIALIRAAKNPKEAREALMAFITPAEAKSTRSWSTPTRVVRASASARRRPSSNCNSSA